MDDRIIIIFGYEMDNPVRMYQDNSSAIWLATHDGAFNKNKHTLIKRAYIREKINNKTIMPIYRETEKMPADMLTKSMNRKY